jgi:ATP-dependent RNA helicase DDX41
MLDAIQRPRPRSAASRSPVANTYEVPADYKPYVPVAKRRAQLLKTLGNRSAKRIKTSDDDDQAVPPSHADQLDADEQARELARRERTLLQAAIDMRERKQAEEVGKSKAELAAVEDAKMLVEMERGQKKLAGAKDIAEGKTWTDSLKTSWRPPAFVRDRTEDEDIHLRTKNHIIVEGDDLPPAIENFTVSSRAPDLRLIDQDMKIPKPILKYLRDKGILKPTPIQMQGLPTA